MSNLNWEPDIEEKFKLLLEKIPGPLRGIAEKKVSQRMEHIVKENNRLLICEKDLVDAFFEETPFGFHGPLKNDMDEYSIDYTKYGYPK